MSSSTEIKAIVFDMGGVLVDLDMDRCRHHFIDKLGYKDIDNILDACHQKGIYSDLEGGTMSPEDFRKEILNGCNPGTTDKDVDEAMQSLLVGIEPYKSELLRDLSTKFDLYMLSNNNSISFARSRAMFEEAGIPVETTFKHLFLSYEMKMLKPSAEIYLSSIEYIGLPAENLLFIDDSQANIDAARSCGMNVLYYKQGDDLKSALQKAIGDCAQW